MFFGGGGGGFPGFDPEEMGGMGGGRSRKKVDNTSLYKLLSRRGERCPGPRPGGMSCNLDQLPSPCPGPPLPPIGGGVTSISEPVVGLSDVGIGERRRVDPRMPQEDPFESRAAPPRMPRPKATAYRTRGEMSPCHGVRPKRLRGRRNKHSGGRSANSIRSHLVTHKTPVSLRQ